MGWLLPAPKRYLRRANPWVKHPCKHPSILPYPEPPKVKIHLSTSGSPCWIVDFPYPGPNNGGKFQAGGRILRQVKFAVVNFAVENFVEPPGLSGSCPRQSPQCALLVCEKFMENPEFRVGNFAVNLKREISHANLKCHETPPPCIALLA